jgi:hypothetical protein
MSASPQSQSEVSPFWVAPLLTVLIVAGAIVYFWLMRSHPYDGDTKHYIAMADGHIDEVRQPFTARVLRPAFAGFVAKTTGLTIDQSFFVTNVLNLAVLVWAGLSLILRHIRSWVFATAIIFSPFVLSMFREIYMPDCMHAAFAAVFFLLLARGASLWAVPLLFFAQIARESTILLTFVLVLVACYQRKWKLAGGALLITLLAMFVVSRVTSQSQKNIHESNTLVYMVGKVPFNFFTNVCGIRMWTNTHAKNDPSLYPDPPLYSFELPAWAPTGAMRQVGVYSIEPAIPLSVARTLLTLFGVMVGLVLFVMYRRRQRFLREDGLSLAGVLGSTYGLFAYLLGPLIGASFGRLIGYGWPMAWIAAPEFLARYFTTTDRLIGQLTAFQVIACWTPLVLKSVGVPNVPADIAAIAIAIPCHVLTIKALRSNWIA